MKTVDEILAKYNNMEISLEDANRALAELKAGYHLEPNGDGGWTEAEMKEGFMPGENHEVRPDEVDPSRRKDLAGQTVMVRTKTATYAVTYDDMGYIYKQIKQ